MLLAASLLALSIVSEPAKPCTAPTQTGVFRITATTKDNNTATVGLVLLESVNNCLEASIIANEFGEAVGIQRAALIGMGVVLLVLTIAVGALARGVVSRYDKRSGAVA